MERKVFKGDVSETITRVHSQNWKCAAYGCPLPGSMSPEIARGDSGVRFYCGNHYARETKNNDLVTFLIKKRQIVYDAIYGFMINRDLDSYCRSVEMFPQFLPKVHEKENGSVIDENVIHDALIYRVLNQLKVEISKEFDERTDN